jgi:hypothetical protein
MPLSSLRTLRIPSEYAEYFDGIDDYVALKSFLAMGITDAYTMEVWFYAPILATGNYQNIFSSDYRSHSIFLHPSISAVDSRVYHGTTVSRVALVDIESNKWYHAVLIAKSYVGAWFYLNGGLKGSISFSDALGDLHFTLALGCKGVDTKGEYFNGIIDEAKLYSRALSQDEILWNYNYPFNPVRNGLVLWLPGTDEAIQPPTWYDKSNFGNNGTIYGALKTQLIRKPVRTLTATRVLASAR